MKKFTLILSLYIIHATAYTNTVDILNTKTENLNNLQKIIIQKTKTLLNVHAMYDQTNIHLFNIVDRDLLHDALLAYISQAQNLLLSIKHNNLHKKTVLHNVYATILFPLSQFCDAFTINAQQFNALPTDYGWRCFSFIVSYLQQITLPMHNIPLRLHNDLYKNDIDKWYAYAFFQSLYNKESYVSDDNNRWLNQEFAPMIYDCFMIIFTLSRHSFKSTQPNNTLFKDIITLSNQICLYNHSLFKKGILSIINTYIMQKNIAKIEKHAHTSTIILELFCENFFCYNPQLLEKLLYFLEQLPPSPTTSTTILKSLKKYSIHISLSYDEIQLLHRCINRLNNTDNQALLATIQTHLYRQQLQYK